MDRLLHSLFALLASVTRQVAYLKEEHRILRARLPECLTGRTVCLNTLTENTAVPYGLVFPSTDKHRRPNTVLVTNSLRSMIIR